MKALVLLPLIAAASFVYAQDSPTIKGHKIGESFNDYLIVENGTAEKASQVMTDCAALLKNPKREQEPYPPFAWVLNAASETCNRYEQALRGLTITVEVDVPYSVNICRTNNQQPIPDGCTISDRESREFQFASTRLVTITLVLVLQDFAEVRRDLIAKFGPPDREEPIPYQNGFGAIFLHPNADWTRRPDVYVGALDNPQERIVVIVIKDRAYAEALAAEKERQRPNSVN